jgi:hypothetical protein
MLNLIFIFFSSRILGETEDFSFWEKGKLREAKFTRESIMQLFNSVCHFFFALSGLHFLI